MLPSSQGSALLYLAGLLCGVRVEKVPEGSWQGTSAGFDMLDNAPGIVLSESQEGSAGHFTHNPVIVIQLVGQLGEEVRSASGKTGAYRTQRKNQMPAHIGRVIRQVLFQSLQYPQQPFRMSFSEPGQRCRRAIADDAITVFHNRYEFVKTPRVGYDCPQRLRGAEARQWDSAPFSAA